MGDRLVFRSQWSDSHRRGLKSAPLTQYRRFQLNRSASDLTPAPAIGDDAARHHSIDRNPHRLVSWRRRCCLRHRSKQTPKTSWIAFLSRSGGISFPSNRSNGPEFRCPSRTSRNETRRSAWVQAAFFPPPCPVATGPMLIQPNVSYRALHATRESIGSAI
jgi:hypothetical protein